MIDVAEQSEIRNARGKFAAMVAAYGLGVFNDGLYRQSAMLVAFAVGRGSMQALIFALFTLPYLLAAAPAGWLADRFSKRRVLIATKALEVVAMLLGAAGIVTVSWPLLLSMAFLMGLQSCLFNPALNGSIPELYPLGYVTRANARLKVVVTAMILAGMAASGLAVGDHTPGWMDVPEGRWVVAIGVVIIAATGLAVSFGVPRRPPADPRAPFPWTGIVATIRQLRAIARDGLLRTVVAANVFVWSIGSLLALMINHLAKEDLHLSDAGASGLVAAELVGVAIGGGLAGRLAAGKRWWRPLAPAAMLMSIPLAVVGTVPLIPQAWQFAFACALLPLVGLSGGLIMVACEAFIQVRPPPERKGEVIASANFAVFAGIIASAGAAWALNTLPSAAARYAIVAGGALAFGIWLRRALRREAVP